MDLLLKLQAPDEVLLKRFCDNCNAAYDNDKKSRCPIRYGLCLHEVCYQCFATAKDKCPHCGEPHKGHWFYENADDDFVERNVKEEVTSEFDADEGDSTEADLELGRTNSGHNGCFLCSECSFPVEEFRANICVECGLSDGFLTTDNGAVRLNANPQKIEARHVMCFSCVAEGDHVDHQIMNYQELKLLRISNDKKAEHDLRLIRKRDTVVNSVALNTMDRLLQAARDKLTKLSNQTMNALSFEEFAAKWDSVDKELSRAHTAMDRFINVAEETERTLQSVNTELDAISAESVGFWFNSPGLLGQIGGPKKCAPDLKTPAKYSKSGKKRRAKKDPNAPKRSMSAYMFWLKDNRARIAKPGMSVIEVTTAAGVEWAKLTDRSKWEQASADDKKRYETEIAAFKASNSPKKTPAKKKCMLPTHVLNSYLPT